jgi:hypothetical protein
MEDLTMTIIEASDYRFDVGTRGPIVTFSAVRIDRTDPSPDDERLIKEYLEDLGKWEVVIKAFSNLLGEAVSKPPPSIKTFSPGAYRIEAKVDEEYVRGTISLAKEERWRRREGSLSIDEILPQLKNVDKWRNLQRAISSLGIGGPFTHAGA